MEKNHPNHKYLLLAEKWINGAITPKELEEYTDWLKQIDPEESLHIPMHIAASKEDHRRNIYEALQRRINIEESSQNIPGYRRIVQLAAIFTGLILLGYFTYYFINYKKEEPAQKTMAVAQSDILPGTNGAVLQLANGKVIVLDTASNGTLADNVMKSQQAIVFEPTTPGEVVQYNTLTTPRARQQQLVLPDGSHVWLNAESSIHFPTAFTGSSREIEITGEVYFEIAHNRKKPFVVHVQQSSVEVLGTHFNVMAYANEHYLETTLLEGAVTFHNNNQQLALKPGQQSRLPRNKPVQLVNNPDIEVVMAWKNGFQSFKNAGIGAILRQIKRWYDVDVLYDGDISAEITFTGEIPREVTLSQLLKALESKQLHFTLDALNRKLHVQITP